MKRIFYVKDELAINDLNVGEALTLDLLEYGQETISIIHKRERIFSTIITYISWTCQAVTPQNPGVR